MPPEKRFWEVGSDLPPEKRRLREETETERWNRNFGDLLQELRVAQTGIQILFAFLLTIPFSSGFPRTTAFQKDVYIVSLLSAAGATAMIIAPVAFHRALFRQRRKPELVRYAHRMATAALGFLLVAMVSSVLLITDFLLAWPMTLILTSAAALFFLTFWAMVPWVRRNWITEDAEEEDRTAEREEAGGDGKREDEGRDAAGAVASRDARSAGRAP